MWPILQYNGVLLYCTIHVQYFSSLSIEVCVSLQFTSESSTQLRRARSTTNVASIPPRGLNLSQSASTQINMWRCHENRPFSPLDLASIGLCHNPLLPLTFYSGSFGFKYFRKNCIVSHRRMVCIERKAVGHVFFPTHFQHVCSLLQSLESLVRIKSKFHSLLRWMPQCL